MSHRTEKRRWPRTRLGGDLAQVVPDPSAIIPTASAWVYPAVFSVELRVSFQSFGPSMYQPKARTFGPRTAQSVKDLVAKAAPTLTQKKRPPSSEP